ncbi:MAG: FkbM family methyltransferase, partial [Candidatus Woesearchaeota archaeon]
EFFINDISEQSSFNRIGKKGKKLKVKTTTLYDYVTENNIKKINFIKIDCEGHDLFVLQGLKKYLNNKFIDIIQFEYGGCNIDSHTNLRDFYELIENKEFVIGKLMPKNIEIRRYAHHMENFHYANYVIISKEFINSNTWIKKYLKGEIK